MVLKAMTEPQDHKEHKDLQEQQDHKVMKDLMAIVTGKPVGP